MTATSTMLPVHLSSRYPQMQRRGSRWYAEHGAEKMTEFERLEWWQVRGDE